MFTIGIFSTHLPYIAFVVFYAYFLIFGVEKASNGELTIGETQFKSEIQLSKSEVNITIDSHYFYHNISGISTPVYHDPFIFKRKVNYPHIYSSENPHFFYSNSLFNRPPPVMV